MSGDRLQCRKTVDDFGIIRSKRFLPGQPYEYVEIESVFPDIVGLRGFQNHRHTGESEVSQKLPEKPEPDGPFSDMGMTISSGPPVEKRVVQMPRPDPARTGGVRPGRQNLFVRGGCPDFGSRCEKVTGVKANPDFLRPVDPVDKLLHRPGIPAQCPASPRRIFKQKTGIPSASRVHGVPDHFCRKLNGRVIRLPRRGTGMQDETIHSQTIGKEPVLPKRSGGFFSLVGIGRGRVDKVACMHQNGSHRRFFMAGDKRVDLPVRNGGNCPCPGRMGKDLDRSASEGFPPLDRQDKPSPDGNVRSEQKGRRGCPGRAPAINSHAGRLELR